MSAQANAMRRTRQKRVSSIHVMVRARRFRMAWSLLPAPRLPACKRRRVCVRRTALHLSIWRPRQWLVWRALAAYVSVRSRESPMGRSLSSKGSRDSPANMVSFLPHRLPFTPRCGRERGRRRWSLGREATSPSAVFRRNCGRLSKTRAFAKLIDMSESLPQTMRAAVYRAPDDVRTETVPVPEIGRGEVLIRIDTCGICGTDLKKIHTGSHSAPRVFGHEMAGTIAAVGEGVRAFAVGDRVMAFHHTPCGHCFYCRKQTFAQCERYKLVGTTAGLGSAAGGGFAQYIRVMDWIVGDGVTPAGLIRVPDDIPFEQAAFIEPVNTCFKAIKLLHLEPDDTVLVIGQGSIGILLAALARQTGATVLTSDMYPERHAIAAKFGLDQPLDARGDVVAACKG